MFALINRTTTLEGRDALQKHIQHPPATYEELLKLQDAIRFWCQHLDKWPTVISNGTLVMLDKFYESADNTAPPATGIAGKLSQVLQKVFNRREYFFTKFSVSHLSDFLKGCAELAAMLQLPGLPPLMQQQLSAMQDELQHPLTERLLAVTGSTGFSELQLLQYRSRRELKNITFRLIAIYARMDA